MSTVLRPWFSRLGIISVAVVAAACSTVDRNEKGRDSADRVARKPLHLAVTPFAGGTVLGNIFRIRLAEPGRLWVLDVSGDPFFHVFDTTGALIVSKGRKGAGPGEFVSPREIFRSGTTPDAMTVFDQGSLRLTTLTADPKAKVQSIVQLTKGPTVIRLIRVAGHYVGWTSSSDAAKRYLIVDTVGQAIATAGGDLLGADSLPDRLRLAASANLTMCARPDGDLFAVAYGSAGRVEIRRAKAELVALAKVPDPSNGDFRTNSEGRLGWFRERVHYTDCTTTAKHVFALYSGRPDKPKPDGSSVGPEYSRFIHVFTWDGALAGVLEVDENLVGLAVDPAETVMYAVGAGNATLFRIALPTDLASLLANEGRLKVVGVTR